MTDQPRGDEAPDAVLEDPRVNPDQLRLFDPPDGHPALVVGCVHDHPASVYRVRVLVRALVPDVVAVELPGLAVPLFERVGRTDGDERSDDERSGGEMSAALAAGRGIDARRVGIDTLNGRFARRLLGEMRRETVAPATVKRVLESVANVSRHALACRASAALGQFGTATPVRRRAYEHEVDAATPPAEQAADERRQLTRSLSVLRAFQRPVADEVIDAARERTMADNLVGLRREGSVVAVVGFDHLSGIADLLEDEWGPARDPSSGTLSECWR